MGLEESGSWFTLFVRVVRRLSQVSGEGEEIQKLAQVSGHPFETKFYFYTLRMFIEILKKLFLTFYGSFAKMSIGYVMFIS